MMDLKDMLIDAIVEIAVRDKDGDVLGLRFEEEDRSLNWDESSGEWREVRILRDDR